MSQISREQSGLKTTIGCEQKLLGLVEPVTNTPDPALQGSRHSGQLLIKLWCRNNKEHNSHPQETYQYLVICYFKLKHFLIFFVFWKKIIDVK